MNDSLLLLGVRAAGVFHFVTPVTACFTPIPAGWEKNLAGLPEVHRRFAVAQNFAIGATIAFCGIVCLGFAPELIAGSTAGGILGAGIAMGWGGRLVILPWLRGWPELRAPFLRVGCVLLCAACATYRVVFSWLALRR